MVSQLEMDLVERDDPTKNITENAREISSELGVNFSTCLFYIRARRKGLFHREYLDQLAIKKGFNSASKYDTYLRARRLGYSPIQEYRNDRNVAYGEVELCFMQDEELEEIPVYDNSVDKNELSSLINDLLNTLNDRQREIIRGVYLLGETRAEVGKRFGISRQRIEDIRMKTIRLLRLRAKKMGLREYLKNQKK